MSDKDKDKAPEYYLDYKYLPPTFRLPFWAVIWLLMDRFDAPMWLHGVFWTIVVLFVVSVIKDRYSKIAAKLVIR